MTHPVPRSPADDAAAADDPVATLQTFVASVQQLPLFTGIAAQLVRSVDREDVTMTELGRLISTDAALVAQLLRLVNSSFYGLPRKIGTVTEAITVLGLDFVRRMVMVAVLQRPLFAYLHDTAAVRAFWRHELLCAALARHLARRDGVDGELAYMAGLLHDVGRLVMLIEYPESHDLLLRHRGDVDGEVTDDDSRAHMQQELALFGFTHAQVGGALLEIWGLPDGIVRAAHQHGDVSQPDDALAAAVWRANALSYRIDDVADDDEEEAWMQAIDLSVSERHKMLEEIEAIEAEAA